MMHLQAQEHQKLPENHQKLRQSRKRLLYSFQREQSPVDTLILGFYPPDLWKNTFLLFWVTEVVALCYGNPGNLASLQQMKIKNCKALLLLVWSRDQQHLHHQGRLWSPGQTDRFRICFSPTSPGDAHAHSWRSTTIEKRDCKWDKQ